MSTTGDYSKDNTIFVPLVYTPSIVQPPVTVDNTIYQPTVLETLSGTVEIIEFAPQINPTFTGTVTVPNPVTTSNDNTAATTSFVKDQISTKIAALVD